MRRFLVITALSLVCGTPAAADTLREPLEKQFYDYFAGQCRQGLVEEAKSMNMDATQPGVAEGIDRYCACTSQAVVSQLDAGEIIAFAIDPSKEPVASKMKPFFEQCHGKS